MQFCHIISKRITKQNNREQNQSSSSKGYTKIYFQLSKDSHSKLNKICFKIRRIFFIIKLQWRNFHKRLPHPGVNFIIFAFFVVHYGSVVSFLLAVWHVKNYPTKLNISIFRVSWFRYANKPSSGSNYIIVTLLVNSNVMHVTSARV